MSRSRRSSFGPNSVSNANPYGFIDPSMLTMPSTATKTGSNSSGSSNASFYDFSSASPNASMFSSSPYTSPDISYTADLGLKSPSYLSGPTSYSSPFVKSSAASKQPAQSNNAFNMSFSPPASAPTSRSASAWPSASASMSPSVSIGQGGSAGPARKTRKDRTIPEANPNDYLLSQPTYPLSSLPPLSYSGPSPFTVPEAAPYLYASQMGTASEIERRLGTIERGIGKILDSRGQRALLDSTLPEVQRPSTTASTSSGSLASLAPSVTAEPWAPTFTSRSSSTRPSSSSKAANDWPMRFT